MISTSEGNRIEPINFLKIFEDLSNSAEKELIKSQIASIQKIMQPERGQSSKEQLLDLVAFHKYKIEEISFEFSVIEEKSKSTYTTQRNFRFPGNLLAGEFIRKAKITVSRRGQIFTELRIDGQLTAKTIVSGKK